MRALREINVSIGFVQVPMQMFKASQTDGLDLKTACECGEQPKMRIVCPNAECGKEYSSWFGVPNRAYEYAKGERIILTQEEMEKARSEAKSYDTIQILKVVDFKKLAIHYCFDDTYYLLPSEDCNEITKKAYGVLVKALDCEGWALLSKATLRNKTHRIAIISDSDMNILIGYRIEDRREIPFEIPHTDITDMEYDQLQTVLKSALTDDAKIEAEPDPLLKLIEDKVDRIYNDQVGKTKLGVAE
ncbi:MAG: hypothetical protein E3J35_00650 [Methanomassiliicoccales archaeon]|nr:MAG: hypothetical protein E3J35_00650 [Methanomassiliicoccales archaeon]